MKKFVRRGLFYDYVHFIGLFKFADGVASNADEIDKMSQKLGMSAQAYQEWDYVMQISGTQAMLFRCSDVPFARVRLRPSWRGS